MDNSNILALKYRPTKLADLVGQDSVVTTITNAFQSNDLYQCFVFSGSFGCGKTSVARILAAMENCEKGRTLEPCGNCKMCRQIFTGESTDVKEVNAASTNGIDDIRNIADFVAMRPLLARVKYVILDECHALSKAAVESALKIIEEPPAGVRFILCTTDLHKMKGTIQSRCQPYRFVKVPWPQLREHLANVSVKEKIQVDDDALKLAARLADGSVRNSLRNLQLMINYAGRNKITVEVAQKALGGIDDNLWFSMLDAVSDKDATSGYKIIQGIFSRGQDVDQVLSGLTEHLRVLMVLLSCTNTAGLISLSEDEKKRYIHQASKMPIQVIIEMISLLTKVARDVTYNVKPQTLMEQFLLQSIICYSEATRK